MTSEHPSENGVDGDDEREEQDDGEEEEEEEAEEVEGGGEEEEEEEPRLKYQRMGGSLPSILSNDMASSIAVAERMIALGTHDGTVHILDFQGNQVKEIAAHTATVNDLSFDGDGEYIGSCSDDGSVVINSLFTDEKLKFEYHRPMKTVALDPDYSRKTSRRFVAGGLAGQLFLNMKNWLGYSKQVLHDGEGPIHSVKWRTSLIAWANEAGVKIYDMANNQRIAFIERPRGTPRAEILLPHLVWQDDTLLVIAWGTSIKIAAIRGNQQNGPNGLKMNIMVSIAKYVDIVASFQTSYHISGVAPYGDALVVLAYIPDEQNGEKDFSTTVPSRQGTAQRPEVRIVTWKNDEVTTDALPVHGYEHYKAKDYALAHAPFTGSSYAGGQWAAGDEPLYYIVSPKDIVIARPRDAEDHIAWLVQHGWHEKALAAVEAGQGRIDLLDEVGARYLDRLIVERRYAEAAARCPKLLRGSSSAWERWVFHFAHLRQLPVLVPYMPTENPRLNDTAYEVALVALANNPAHHKLLLWTVKSWPPSLYSALPVISAIEPQLNTSSMTDSLKEALAELYAINNQYEKAFSIYADLSKPEIFYFIEKHNLHDIVHEKSNPITATEVINNVPKEQIAHTIIKEPVQLPVVGVVKLMKLDSKKTVQLLIQHRDAIAPFEIVEELLNSNDSDGRYFLHLFLHSLFETDIHAGREFHDMQVELYADFEPRMLLTFLRTSQNYNLDKAYEILLRKGPVREQVYVLGRMGNAKQALSIIINKLEDIQEAVEFVTEQHDDELWDEFIKQCLQKGEMVGMLLEHTVGNLDPLYIVNMVPDGLEIPRLRDRLVKIITDYRTETSLRQGCNDILKADCVNLLVKYLNEAKHGIHLGSEEEDTQASTNDIGATLAGMPFDRQPNTSRTNLTNMKSKSRGGRRCCICLEPFPMQGISVVTFFCCHAYHESCLQDGLDNIKGSSDSDSGFESDEDENKDQLGEPRMRCVLCTTAAG